MVSTANNNHEYDFSKVSTAQEQLTTYEREERLLLMTFRKQGLDVPQRPTLTAPIGLCNQQLPCTHECAGCAGESSHLGCREPGCA